MPRLISLDIGDVRIGVASTDETAFLVSPMELFTRTASIKTDVRNLAALINELKPKSVIIGLPLNSESEKGKQAEKVLEFSKRLANQISANIIFWDERFSTQEAQEELIEMGASRKKRRKVIDNCAAVMILENYMNSNIGDN